MPKVTVYNTDGEPVGDIDLNEDLFGQPVNEAVIHEVVVMQLANRRRGTHSTKTRGQVRGGGRKPWRQKGTGRARHGSIRSPIWRGGGVVFGPRPRDYSYQVPKKIKRLALKSALSAKVNDGLVLVLDALTMAEPKTKEMIRILKNLQATDGALLVTASQSWAVDKSASNIPGVKTLDARRLNVYDLLGHHNLILTKDALTCVEEVFA